MREMEHGRGHETQFRPKASAWSLFMLVYGPRACPSLFFWKPWTLFFANSSSGQPGSQGRHELEVALTQVTGSSEYLLPPAKGAAHLPSQIQARNSLRDASVS